MSAQLAPILAALDRHRHWLDFDRDELAGDVAETTAAAIEGAMDAQVDPQGNPWPELSERYERWKSARFPGQPMAELYGKMKQYDQLRGTLEITRHTLKQTYGTDDECRQEAEWFQEGSGRQPPRRFYDLNDLALVNLGLLLDDRFRFATS